MIDNDNDMINGTRENEKKRKSDARLMPMVSVRGLVVFPGMQLHFDLEKDNAKQAVKAAMESNRELFIVTQKDIGVEDPKKLNEFYSFGVICRVLQLATSSRFENTLRVVADGVSRGRIKALAQSEPYCEALVLPKKTQAIKPGMEETAEGMSRVLKQSYFAFSIGIPGPSDKVMLDVYKMSDLGELADYCTANTALEADKKMIILEELDPLKRAEKAAVMLQEERRLLDLEESINDKVQKRMDDEQREYYLREQLRAINEELEGESEETEAERFRREIIGLDIPEEDKKKLLTECGRLVKTPSSSPEAMVIRNYLETVLALPWSRLTKDKLNLERAEKKLNADHYGLEDVKTRMLEMLAVRSLAPDVKGQIICLVGPPGVGKTSIARSVAEAMGRKYCRIALGGISDEAEIRGHRKTYIGSMPGRIMEAISKAGTKNPLMLLDEVDKLGHDHRGDPTSALLEVLDAEQNNAFVDHYIEIPFDLSKVLFITTANDASAIPGPLLDRMEIIELGSYTAEEKFHIAKKHLIPKQAKLHGLSGRSLRITDKAIKQIIDLYTREAGVRQLERELAAVCRKAAVAVTKGEKLFTVNEDKLKDVLGAPKYKADNKEKRSETGVVTGLAWTSVGGETLEVEAAVLEGSGKLELTGSLGSVMQESAKAAISFIRANVDKLEIDPDFYKTKDIHLHFPEGAVPKDGPSAGITIATALVSALSKKPVSKSIAMTGEITVRGRVLSIGGLKEKSMAAYKAGVKKVIIPESNLPDLEKADEAVKAAVEFIPVTDAMQVMREVFRSGEQVSD